MSDTTGLPTTDSENVTYADISDVQEVIRSFEFDDTTIPTQSQVESIIEKKTRNVEKELPTAFRELAITDLSVNAEPKSIQKRDKNTVRSGGVHNTGRLTHRATTDKWIKVQLPHYFIQNVSKLVLKSSTGEEVIELDNPEYDDAYDINYRDGSIRINYTYFPATSGGTAGSNRLRDIRIEVSYTYGRDFIEPDISEAVSKLTAYDIITTDAFSEVMSEEDTFLDLDDLTELLQEDANEIIERYKY